MNAELSENLIGGSSADLTAGSDLVAGDADHGDEAGRGDEDDDEEILSPEEVLGRMRDAWINEKFAPDLLEPKMEVVDCLLEQVEEESSAPSGSRDFGASLRRMEAARVRFLVASYLRLRLEKIQKYVFHLLESQEAQENIIVAMTPQELRFATQFRKDLEAHFKRLALDHLPSKVAELNLGSSAASSSASVARQVDPPVPRPDLSKTVFVRAVRDVRGVLIEDEANRDRDEEYDMAAGSQHILKYRSVAHLIRNGSVRLM